MFFGETGLANILDATASFTISLTGQGFGYLAIILSTPGGSVAPGTAVTVKAGVRNTGSADTIWCQAYANNVAIGTIQISPLANNELHYFDTPFTVNQTTTFSADCGHMVGTTYVKDHDHTESPTYTVTLLNPPNAAFVGDTTYSPGQTVGPGEPVTIGYQVQNTGGAGALWGGLYDYATPPLNLIGGYWEQNVPAGETISKTVVVSAENSLVGQLLIGHIE